MLYLVLELMTLADSGIRLTGYWSLVLANTDVFNIRVNWSIQHVISQTGNTDNY